MSGIVTFGEAMLRLSPPGAERLERTDRLEVHVAGAESNMAAAAARAGAEATWVSKLPDSPLGRRVTNGLHGVGLDTEVEWAEGGRQPIYYVEPGSAPRGTDVIYDRDDSSFRTATVEELTTKGVEEAEIVATTGITPALSMQLVETTQQLLSRAREAGATTAFDVNYRSKLWSPASARSTIAPLLESVDVLFVGEEDAATVLGIEGKPEAVLAEIRDRWSFDIVVLTRGSWGSIAWADGETFEQRAFETDTVDPIGTGDAFAGAFLARSLEGGSVPQAQAFGTATAALKRTIPGDMAVVTREEIERVLDTEAADIRR